MDFGRHHHRLPHSHLILIFTLLTAFLFCNRRKGKDRHSLYELSGSIPRPSLKRAESGPDMVDFVSDPSVSGGWSDLSNGVFEHDVWFNRAVKVGAGVTLTLTPRTAAMESPCGFMKKKKFMKVASRLL